MNSFIRGPRNTGGLILLFHFSIPITLFNFGYIIYLYFFTKKILNLKLNFFLNKK